MGLPAIMATEDRVKVRVAACWNATLVVGANAAAVEANIIIMVEVAFIGTVCKFPKKFRSKEKQAGFYLV